MTYFYSSATSLRSSSLQRYFNACRIEQGVLGYRHMMGWHIKEDVSMLVLADREKEFQTCERGHNVGEPLAIPGSCSL